jgi:hypothetical protein
VLGLGEEAFAIANEFKRSGSSERLGLVLVKAVLACLGGFVCQTEKKFHFRPRLGTFPTVFLFSKAISSFSL